MQDARKGYTDLTRLIIVNARQGLLYTCFFTICFARKGRLGSTILTFCIICSRSYLQDKGINTSVLQANKHDSCKGLMGNNLPYSNDHLCPVFIYRNVS